MAALEANAVAFPWSLGQYLDSLTGSHQAYALEQAGDMTGLVVVMTVLDQAEILNLVIEHAHQGQGLGRELLRRVLQQLKQQGCLRVYLEVRETNRAARSLYHHMGFIETGLRKDYYPSATGREHAILMEIAL